MTSFDPVFLVEITNDGASYKFYQVGKGSSIVVSKEGQAPVSLSGSNYVTLLALALSQAMDEIRDLKCHIEDLEERLPYNDGM